MAEAHHGAAAADLRLGRVRSLVAVAGIVFSVLARGNKKAADPLGPRWTWLAAENRWLHLIVRSTVAPPRSHLGAARTSFREECVVPMATEGGRFDEKTFTAALRDLAGPRALSGFQLLLPWSKETFEWVYWGTRKTPTFLGGLTHWPHTTRFLNFYAVWPNGSYYIEMRYLRNFPPFDHAERRERLRETLARMPGTTMSSAPWRPSFDVAVLTNDRAWALFTKTVEEAVRELLEARDGH
jgi:hypothetical protein